MISCLLVSHNKPDYVCEAVRSVLNQSFHDFELLITDSGKLFDEGYFNQFKDSRIKLFRSFETEHTRRSVAIAPWCYNNMLEVVKGDLILYLCDDDIYYPFAFEIFNEYMNRNKDWLACYSSQHFGSYIKGRNNIILGTRHAHIIRGRGIAKLDCQVDYMQLCHRKILIDCFNGRFWNEDRKHKTHSDGILLEKIGEVAMIHPIPAILSMNRRTILSDNAPLK